MTTMLDKCAVAGDITQGIDRRGVWTAAITVIGGTSNTAVKLVSCDTVDGEYTDFKTLISAAEAETDQYKGFVVDLHGAKKFIKVTGAVMATAVFGDCDHDVKAIAITGGEVPSGADLENNKEVEITENGEIEITPSAGKDGMKKVTATVNVSGGAELEDNKTATIDVSTYTEPVEVTPSEGKDGMKKVTVSLSNMPAGANMLYCWTESEAPTYLDVSANPNIDNIGNVKCIFFNEAGAIVIDSLLNSLEIQIGDIGSIVDIEDGFKINNTSDEPLFIFYRDATKDVTVW